MKKKKKKKKKKKVMRSQVHIALLSSLKRSTNNIKQIDQILTQTITTGLIIHHTPTWNSILRAYSKSPTPIKTILIYNYYLCINSKSINNNHHPRPDNYTYPPLLKACSNLHLLSKGREAHAHLIKVGLDCFIYVQNALIHFYGSTAHLSDAFQVFDIMPHRDVTSWNTLLATCNSSPVARVKVMDLFKEMLREGSAQADGITMVILLANCVHRRESVLLGKALHAYTMKGGISFNLNLENALLSMYAKFGEMNTALGLFSEMRGRRDVVSRTILINGYVEKGDVDSARGFFDQMADKDTVLWNSMIRGYVKAKQFSEALALFKRLMENEKVKPDETTVVSVLEACGSLSDLQYGRLVHQFILRKRIRRDMFVNTTLIDMYSKCGSLEDAVAVFYKMEEKDVFTWTTMISGLANFGYANEAFRLFNEMERSRIEPNEATFVSVLAACRQGGLLNEGCVLFKKMVDFYNIQPKVEHIGCVIDLLSRAGLLNQAEELIKCMRTEERLIAYKTLLTACMNYSEMEIGLKIANELIIFGSESVEVYILLSNFYALVGQWAKVAEIRGMMKNFEMKREPGISSIEVIKT